MILRSAVFEHIFPTKHVEYAFVQLSVIELIGSRTEIIITIVIIFNVSQWDFLGIIITTRGAKHI